MDRFSWQDFLKLTPLFYVYIVLISFMKQYIYYQFFNINISDYLELSEILVSFLDDTFIYGLFIIYVIAVYFFMSKGYVRFMNLISRKILTFIHWLSKKERKSVQILDKHVWIFFLVIAVGYGVIFFRNAIHHHDWIVFASVRPVVIISIIVLFLLFHYSKLADRLNNILVKELILFSIILFLFNIERAVLAVNQVKYKNKIYITEIAFKDQKIKSDENKYFIGKTINYVFLFNKNDNKTTAYSLNDIIYIR